MKRDKKKNRKGFTLIELIAVIVILGILMLIAIPAVSRYIEKSKKETYIKTINSLVDTVRYAINSGDSNYSMNGISERKFKFKDIETEKGKLTKSSYGSFIEDFSYVIVKKDTNGNYTYEVQAKDTSDYTIPLINVNDLDASKVKKYSELTEDEKRRFQYGTYSIGDEIQYKGSTWYVIKNSSLGEDYVTLLKQTLLTKEEIGNSYSQKFKCEYYHIQYGSHGCTSVGEIVTLSSMAYYWSATCNTYGVSVNPIYGTDTYNLRDASGCSGHNDYARSKIKQAVEEYMTNYLDATELKEVDGYKIRLITKEEIATNLGWTAITNYTSYPDNSNVPTWLYQDMNGYWTMTPDDNAYVGEGYWVLIVCPAGFIGSLPSQSEAGVRPVINLKKSVIENL